MGTTMNPSRSASSFHRLRSRCAAPQSAGAVQADHQGRRPGAIIALGNVEQVLTHAALVHERAGVTIRGVERSGFDEERAPPAGQMSASAARRGRGVGRFIDVDSTRAPAARRRTLGPEGSRAWRRASGNSAGCGDYRTSRRAGRTGRTPRDSNRRAPATSVRSDTRRSRYKRVATQAAAIILSAASTERISGSVLEQARPRARSRRSSLR